MGWNSAKSVDNILDILCIKPLFHAYVLCPWTKNVPWHILAPAAVACDIYLIRRSVHRRGAFFTLQESNFLQSKKKALISSRLFSCRRWDLNPHDIATTGTWSLRVCQFRHSCEQMIFYRFNGNKSTPIFNFFPFFEKIYKIDKNRKKLKIGIDNCPGICYYLQVVMRRKFIRYAEVSELADEQD